MQAQCWICPRCYDDRDHQAGDKYCEARQRINHLEDALEYMVDRYETESIGGVDTEAVTRGKRALGARAAKPLMFLP